MLETSHRNMENSQDFKFILFVVIIVEENKKQ